MKKNLINRMILENYYETAAKELYDCTLEKLNVHQLDTVIAKVVTEKYISKSFEKSLKLFSVTKTVIYFSIEFLIGRIVLDVLNNTRLKQETKEIFNEKGIDINSLEDIEDAALGNGGLGRLAACFIESAATQGYRVVGAGIFYNYGFFKQKINKLGKQEEEPEDWTKNGVSSWFIPHKELTQVIEFSDSKVIALPYIMPVIGFNYDMGESNVNPLILWKAENYNGETNAETLKISDFLYPDDSNESGYKLRMRQELFFTSATMQYLMKTHLKKFGTLDNFDEYYEFQLNDTHPTFAIIEFIRLMKKLAGYSFKQALGKAKLVFNYTNHTIMSEALECWDREKFNQLMPEQEQVVEDINQAFIDEVKEQREFCSTVIKDGKIVKIPIWEKINKYEMFCAGKILMANIACYVCKSINGVSVVHSEIIKKETLKQWYSLYPYKFNNKTNGVTFRRWLELSNEPLAKLITKYCGTAWITDSMKLLKLQDYKSNNEVLKEFAQVKQIAKINLSNFVMEKYGIEIDPESIFDIQVKRIHEYKRQLLNCLRILKIYHEIKIGNLPGYYKTTFIISGKAAPGYKKAKLIIKLINDIQCLVNEDPEVNKIIKVLFLPDFKVSLGEKIYPAADLHQQISMAGTEASGTGNMKFMLNGACILGTYDGANIEICEEAKAHNEFMFGATVDEFERLRGIYNHEKYLKNHPECVEIINFINRDHEKIGLKNAYPELSYELLNEDKYKLVYDYNHYINSTLAANREYAKEKNEKNYQYFTRKCFLNTARAGKFSSDRTIDEYAKEIWKITK